jgi:hypothetical protein
MSPKTFVAAIVAILVKALEAGAPAAAAVIIQEVQTLLAQLESRAKGAELICQSTSQDWLEAIGDGKWLQAIKNLLPMVWPILQIFIPSLPPLPVLPTA